MTMLSDTTIRSMVNAGHLGLDPFTPGLVQPASVDVRLDRWFRTLRTDLGPNDPGDPADSTTLIEVSDGDRYELAPGGFVLGSTLERVMIPAHLACRVEGKSSLGRIGLMIHSTAGWVDPGFAGYITLEISNVSPVPVLLYTGMLIAQLAFMRLDKPAGRPYGASRRSHYQDQQRGPQPSRGGQVFLTWPTDMKTQHVEQAPPVVNDGPIIQDLVLDDIRDRKALGIERYGTGLQPHNGRDMLRDAYEEALDLAVYLRGCIAERDLP